MTKSKSAWVVMGATIVGLTCAAEPLNAASNGPPVFSPNPSVGWISLSTDFSPPRSGAGPVKQDPRFPRVTNEEYRATGRQPTIAQGDPEAPILQPWVREALRTRNALVQSGKGGLSRQASCWPVGVPAFVLHVIHPIFLIPGPKEVVMVWQGNHVVRRVHLNVPHSREVKPSWFGESVGHYENGDTLVIDTIGLDDRTHVDLFRTPHTSALHVVERWRLINGGREIELQVYVEDEGAFKAPYVVTKHYARTDARWIEAICAENPIGPLDQGLEAMPQAQRPDF
jgi:hypothetical protein